MIVYLHGLIILYTVLLQHLTINSFIYKQESITTTKSSSPSMLVDMSTFKTIEKNGTGKNTDTSMMKNITRSTEVPDDEVLCECCNKMIWYGDYVQ